MLLRDNSYGILIQVFAYKRAIVVIVPFLWWRTLACMNDGMALPFGKIRLEGRLSRIRVNGSDLD